MILVKPSYEIIRIMGAEYNEYFESAGDSLLLIEQAGRTCYKSEDKITPDSSKKFIQKLLRLGHESVLEHSAMTVKFICDRGVSHELVRHRLASYSQESTRYCNYKGGVTFIIPNWINIPEVEIEDTNDYQLLIDGEFDDIKVDQKGAVWLDLLLHSESTYLFLAREGWSPQQARSVLPNSLKTEIVMTTNFREWRHIFKLRTASNAHPQIRELMIPLLNECKKLIPVIFSDLGE